jgi:hypothetical protein
MVREGLCVPKVDAGQEITLLTGGELLENLLNIDVRHCEESEESWLENKHDLLYTAELLRQACAREGRRFK